jgi:hypothetical protein
VVVAVDEQVGIDELTGERELEMAALFLTDRLMVQPVAISGHRQGEQSSPDESPPSWPTRSISTNPGMSSSHSAQVGSGSGT